MRDFVSPRLVCVLMLLCASTGLAAESLTNNTLPPFAAAPVDAKASPGKSTRLPNALLIPLNCIGSKSTSSWNATGIALRWGQKLFTMEKEGDREVLRLDAHAFAPDQTYLTYSLLVPQIKPGLNVVSLLAKSTKNPVQLSVQLSNGAGKTTVQINPGEWQRLVLPVAQFGMKRGSTLKSVGLGITSADENSDVLIADIAVGISSHTPESLAALKTSVSLIGQWRFTPDDGERGIKENWASPDFDDSKWKVLKSNLSWQDQGITHAGWGWFRQKLVLAKETQNAPLTIALAELGFEDDVYFNGSRIGGLVGNYKYNNLVLRNYTVPAQLIRYDQPNTIAIRVWGADGTNASSARSGLTAGIDPKGTYYVAESDPYAVRLTRADDRSKELMPDQFDMSEAQKGLPFDVIFRFPADVMNKGQASLYYTMSDFYGKPITSGSATLAKGPDGLPRAVVSVDAATSRTIYLRGRFKAFLAVSDANGTPICTDVRDVDRLSYGKRDTLELPPLADTREDTPYGKLKLVDEIDAATPAHEGLHPYMQGGFDHRQNKNTPGADVNISITEILGRKARESGFGFFAYRIGRGKLKIHGTYLLRVEYPEDKTRYAPFEIQNGHNFMDVGWKNGVNAEDPYDNWPLSGKWQWYDTIVVLDEETTGTAGTGGASAEHGVWVYFMNKLKPGRYYNWYAGGPAVGRIKLYELDPEKNQPVIRAPKNQPQRTLMVDWERQADQPPGDVVRYAKLMGYNAVSPIMLKWAFMNYGEPMKGYETTIVDGHRYWIRKIKGQFGATEETAADDNDGDGESTAAPAAAATSDVKTQETGSAPAPGTSVHAQYLALTKKHDIRYVPRIEYGGSLDLPTEARSIGGDGEPAKPNRFAAWGADLLHPATWTDLSRTVDHYIKPYVKDNPQLTGVLWRIRSDRMQISYSRDGIERFAKETGTSLPKVSNKELAIWASTGAIGEKYADWWHQQRAAFHAKLAEQLRGYRPDMRLYYFNWDSDKFSLGLRDFNTAATFMEMSNARYGLVPYVYSRHIDIRKRWTGEDYVRMIRTGQITDFPGWGHDYGLRTELYRNIRNVELFAPANWLYMADNPVYLDYFRTHEGLAVSNIVSYDELGSRTINPKFEGNMVIPAGPQFSMALELLAYFHGDARTLTYTVYTYGRGFADAHRRFAQAYLALPAIPGKIVAQNSNDVKVRLYETPEGTYVGIAHKGYAAKALTIQLPGNWSASAKIVNQVTGEAVPFKRTGEGLVVSDWNTPAMNLDAWLITNQ